VSIIPTVELHRYTMVELYELRRVIIRHSRSIPPGPARNEHRQVAVFMRSLSRDRSWLAAHTVDGAKSRTEQARQVAEENANDQREIITKLRKPLN